MGLPRVMFVDDEAHVLAGLRRSLRRQQERWELLFATGGEEALAMMGGDGVDVVVSDMRMPGMDGGQLLTEVKRRHPQAARVVLSGHADRSMVVSAVGVTHQYLAKPCDIGLLVDTVQNLIDGFSIIDDTSLQAVLGDVESLPKPPSILEDLLALIGSPDTDVDDVVHVVERDIATTAEVLRLVNSSFFSLPGRVDSLQRAVSLLGLDTIQALAVSGAVFVPGPGTPPDLDVQEVSMRGLAVAETARRLALMDGWPSMALADVFFAGLMHEVGLLVLAAARPASWAQWHAGSYHDLLGRTASEVHAFGSSTTAASAYLLRRWGFGESVVEAIAAQPALSAATASPAAEVVSVARQLELFGPSGLRARRGSYVDAARLARWESLWTSR